MNQLINKNLNQHKRTQTSIIISDITLWFRSGITQEQLKFLANVCSYLTFFFWYQVRDP